MGNFPLRSCFFLGNFFNDVFQKWLPKIAHKYYYGYRYDKTSPTYRVLEFILLNRGATIKDIIASTQLSEQEVRNILKNYSIRLSDTYHYARLYESSYQSSRSVDVTIDFLNHLIVIPIKGKREGDEEELNDGKYEKYELSLLGILLMMGGISLMRQQNIISYPLGYYNKIAAGYKEKLPLIFGKWELLKSNLDFYSRPSIFDHLFLDKSEILSLSVLLGGNKEVYDNVKSAALSTINKFFIIYDAGISVLDSEYPKEFFNSKHYQFILDKLNGIEILLRYSDLRSFGKYMSRKRESTEYISAPVSLIHKDMPLLKVLNQLLTNNKEKNLTSKMTCIL